MWNIRAMVTYVAGIRMATTASRPARLPWRTRISRYVNHQASSPRGVFGRLLGFIWTLEHRRVNEVTLDLLEIGAAHDVLELGCGPGTAVREAARRAPAGRVVGLDVSDLMVRVARRRNCRALRAGRVEISRIQADDLARPAAAFDRAFSVHCLYFWTDSTAVLRQLAGALRAGGRLVLAFRPNGPDLPSRFRDETYRFYEVSEVESMLRAVGFGEVCVVTRPEHGERVVWVLAERGNS